MISETSGSQAATIGTEHTLATVTGLGTRVLVVDTNAMALGDVLELRIYTKAKTGSVSRQAFFVAYAHAQDSPNKYSIPVPADVEFKATLKQTAGTGRTYDWNILKL